MKEKKRKKVGITMGDPLGIGPEILVKALSHPKIYKICKPLILGDMNLIKTTIKLLGFKNKINLIKDPKHGKYEFGTFDLINISNIKADIFSLKKPSFQIGNAIQNYIIKGINLALNNQICALVTCPINKMALKIAKSKFHGHTEMLASLTNTDNFAMMLTGSKLKVVPVTIHLALELVKKNLNIDKIFQTIKLSNHSLSKNFDIKNPKIAVAGLNPHAGEQSMFGNEEKKIIMPAVKLAKREGIIVKGPISPDIVFHQTLNKQYDAVVCMYHDQGLIPFKLIHFKDGVNTTLGLPIIRTSVDHGTAYDIAWQKIANPLSLIKAIEVAVFQINNTMKSSK